jgi:monoamine oxidase
LKAADLRVLEMKGNSYCCDAGSPQKCDDVERSWHQVSKGFRSASKVHDHSFTDYMNTARYPDRVRAFAMAYVEGFHAARPEHVSIRSLAVEQAAAERIGGDTLLRIEGGYDRIIRWLASAIPDIRLHCEVMDVEWQRGSVRVHTTDGDFEAPHCVVTLPASLLAANAIRFTPELAAKSDAARRLAEGNVARVTLTFTEKVWEKRAPRMSFCFCPAAVFPTWWTRLPEEANVFTAWAGGPKADVVLGRSSSEIIALAIGALAGILSLAPNDVEPFVREAHFHDWSADRFARGAYSYTPVNAWDARAELAAPVAETLFFAGEAANTSGEHGTVHGAIATGLRAAAEIIGLRRLRGF